MNAIAKALTLTAMFSTVAWFFWNPVGWVIQWEPVVVFLLALAGFIVSNKSGSPSKTNAENENPHPHDIQLFSEFRELLPSNTFITFLKTHDFYWEFNLEKVDPLRMFIHGWTNAECEFQDPEIEIIRKLLLEANEDLSYKISKYTSRNRFGFQAVLHDSWKDDEEHENRLHRESDIINSAAHEFVRIHQEMIRVGLKKCIKQ